MKTWSRATVPTRCGNCPAVIARGEPVIVLKLGNIKRPFYRCQFCAMDRGEDVPPDLPALVETKPIPELAMTPIRALPFDFKAAQFRDPGEEG